MGSKEQGIYPERWKVIPRVLIFTFSGNRVLLIKGAPSKRIWANRFNGLGGHIERGEDALTAAQRELAEESGLTRVDLHLAGSVFIEVEGETGILLFVFWGEADIGTPLKTSTEGELHWVGLDEIDQLPVVEDLPILLGKVKQARVMNGIIFHAIYQYDQNDQLVISFTPESDRLS